tara:strand:- start:450 stop:1307 length:858 start_codon:yes stop_codon:yes gene_type:complete
MRRRGVILVFAILVFVSFLSVIVSAEKIGIEAKEGYLPSENLDIKLTLYDDDSNKIPGLIDYQILNYYSEVVKQGKINSGDNILYELPTDSYQGPWKIIASYNEIEVNNLFNVGELEIKCDEGRYNQNISVSIPILEIINIGEISQEKDIVKISYNFDNSYVIGDTASVDIWIEDSEGYEVSRFQDVFDITKEGIIERNIEIEFEGSGVYSIYFALSNDLDSFVRESVVLGEVRGTGFTIFDEYAGKFGIYIGFIVLIGVIVFFIWRRHGKQETKKHHWLVRKKK